MKTFIPLSAALTLGVLLTSTALVGGAGAQTVTGPSVPANCVQNGIGAMACGSLSAAPGTDSTAIGQQSDTDGTRTTAVGYGASALNINATSVGAQAVANQESATALGTLSGATGLNATAVGAGANANNENATALGRASSAQGVNSTAVGVAAVATADGSIAIGVNSRVGVGANGSVAIGNGSLATESNVVSFGSSDNKRRLVNVGDGIDESDAVTVRQLIQMGQTYGALSNTYTDTKVAGAITTANTYTDTQVAGAKTYTDTQVAGAVTTAKAYTDTQVTTAVATAKSYTDTRVNFAIDQSKLYTDSQIGALSDRMDRRFDAFDSRLKGLGATSAALAGLHPNPSATGPNQLAVAIGGYRGETAFAAGYYRHLGDNVMLSVGVATNDDGASGNLGASFSW